MDNIDLDALDVNRDGSVDVKRYRYPHPPFHRIQAKLSHRLPDVLRSRNKAEVRPNKHGIRKNATVTPSPNTALRSAERVRSLVVPEFDALRQTPTLNRIHSFWRLRPLTQHYVQPNMYVRLLCSEFDALRQTPTLNRIHSFWRLRPLTQHYVQPNMYVRLLCP